MNPIKIAYTRLGTFGTVSGIVKREGDMIECWIYFYDVEKTRSHFVHSAQVDADDLQQHIDSAVERTKTAVMKHASREGHFINRSDLKVLGSIHDLCEDTQSVLEQLKADKGCIDVQDVLWLMHSRLGFFLS